MGLQNELIRQTTENSHHYVGDLQDKTIEKVEIFQDIFVQQWNKTLSDSNNNLTQKWEEIVPSFFDFYSGYLAINWIDVNGTVRIVYPYETNKILINKSIVINARGIENPTYKRAKETGTTSISPYALFFQGGHGLAAYIPFYSNQTIIGFINVVFETEPLFEEYVISRDIETSESIQVIENNVTVYHSGPVFSLSDKFTVNSTLSFYNREWSLYVRPLQTLVEPTTLLSNSLIFILGLLSSILAFFVVNFLIKQNNEKRNRVLEQMKFENLMSRINKLDSLATMAGGMAHDFNNLLMAIQGNLSILSMNIEKLDNKNQEFNDAILRIQDIEQILHRSKDLTQQILMFSRQPSMEVETFVLRELLISTVKISKDPSRITIQDNNDNLKIKANYARFQQVLLNIINNSFQAGSTSVTIQISSVANKNANTPEVILQIMDNGKGMDEKTMEHAFDAFYTTKSPEQGTGLGLTQVKKYIERIGGTVNLSSEVGKGTSVEIRIPETQESVLPKASGPTMESVKEECQRVFKDDLKRPTCLLIEDERSISINLSEFLSIIDINVERCFDGETALRLYQTEKYSLVIIDVMLPGINGVEVFNEIQKISKNQKVLFITGFTEVDLPKSRKSFIQALHKPFTQIEFYQKIISIFSEENS